jgi:hypothetical protein
VAMVMPFVNVGMRGFQCVRSHRLIGLS